MSPQTFEERTWLKTPWPLSFFLTLAGIVLILFTGNPLERFESQWFDQCLRWRFQSGQAAPVDDRILHLDITAGDLKNLPGRREEYGAAAQLIREASALGARMLVFDIIYGHAEAELAQPILESINETAVPVVLAEGLSRAPDRESSPERVRSFPFLKIPYAPSGLINIESDGDGVYRRYPLFQPGAENSAVSPSLAFRAYLVSQGVKWPRDVSFPDPHTVSWEILSADGTKREMRKIQSGGSFVPILDMRSGWDAEGPAAFPHLNLSGLHELYRSAQQTGARPLAGKILFVSYVVSGVSDFGSTPFGKHQPLVQLHSAAFNDLAQDTFHYRLGRAGDGLVLTSILLMGLIAGFSGTKKKLMAFWFLGALMMTAADIFLLWRTRFVIPFAMWTALWVVACVIELLRRHTLELLRRVRMHITMGYYFSPKVLERVLAEPGATEPKKAELTVLLSDLRNFTPLSERLGIQGTFALLNRIFEAQTRVAVGEDATLEHFIGDQFMCYWGAPDPQPDAADRGVRGAVEMMKALQLLEESLEPEIRLLFGYGLALHKGTAMIGNIGSKFRMDYGVVGDLINSAARVESLTKNYGTRFILTRETYSALSTPIPYRVVDRVLPVGKSTPLELLEIRHAFSSPHFDQIAAAYTAAYGQYQQGNFQAAARDFLDIAETYGDKASQLLARRSQDFAREAPKLWTGVYRFQAK